MHKAGMLGIALSLAGGLAIPAAAVDFVWMYDRYLDADPFQTRLTLAFAIPQTDAFQFVATCEIGAGGPYAIVEIGARVDDMTDGTPVQVTFHGDGFNHVATGEVVGARAEIGITGVRLEVALDDPLWRAMQALTVLSYNTRLFADDTLDLTNAAGPVAGFVADCRKLPVPGDTPVAALPPADTNANVARCEALGSLRTVQTGAPATVTFVNQADGFRSVLWIDGDGMPVLYGDLNPGEAYVQRTFVGHPWMISDGPGNCLEIYLPPAGASTFAITASEPGLGAE